MRKDAFKSRRMFDLRSVPIYPLLFGIYPILALTAYNIDQMNLNQSYRALLFSLVLAMVLYAILRLVLHSWRRAALLALIWLALFYTYGHIYLLLKNQTLFGILIGRHRYLMTSWIALAALAIWLVSRKRSNLRALTQPLNLISLLLVTFAIVQIAKVQLTYAIRTQRQAGGPSTNPASTSHRPYPDIYYIILDGYGRSDILAELFQYDNSDFIHALERRGFYVANCSQSNYSHTLYTIVSLLNLHYLDVISPDLDNLLELSRANLVRDVLSEHGYTIVGFETGYRWTEWNDADVYLPLEERISTLNGLEALYFETTPVRLIMDFETARYLENVVNLHEVTSVLNNQARHHAQGLNILQALKGMPDRIESPKFVFAHLTIAHWPFVFGRNGELTPAPTTEQEERIHYVDALTYLDAEIPEVIDSIIANSETPPIIIIQADHGPFHIDEVDQRMKILSAYYLPDYPGVLYSTLSPVNTFRMIFSAYFGDDYDLLDDQSWYSPSYVDNTIFLEIPNHCEE